MSVKKDIKLNGIDLTVEEKYESGSSIGGGNIISKDDNNQIRLNPNNLCVETTKDNGSHWSPCGKNEYDNNNVKKGEIFNDYTNNTAPGDYSHAEGSNTHAVGENSHASGLGTMAEHKNSFVMGEGTSTFNDNSLVCGQYNAGTISTQGDGNLFVVGNGYMSGQQAIYHSAFTINKDGNALINGDGISGSGNGNLNVVNNISAGGNITITGDATINGTINGITNSGNITNTGNIINTGNITNSNNITNTGHINTGTFLCEGDCLTKKLYIGPDTTNNWKLKDIRIWTRELTTSGDPSILNIEYNSNRTAGDGGGNYHCYDCTIRTGILQLCQSNNTSNHGALFYNYGSSERQWIFKDLTYNGGMYTFQNRNENAWFKLNKTGGSAPSLTINHISTISENTNLNDYIIGKPIFLGDKYKKYNYYNSNYMNNFNDINDEKIKIDSSTCDTTLFNISNIPNNNFVGICSIISEPKIIKKTLEQPFNQYSIHELTQNEINEQNIDINNLPNDYSLVYKVYNYNDLNNAEPYIYYNVPIIAFATHGDYMFYVDDTEALIDTNLNTQKHYEVGDELTYDGKILILPEFNPDETLTELEQLQQLLNYNKQISKYNKLKKNSIGKISHIFTSQDCDDYKHYLAVFKSN